MLFLAAAAWAAAAGEEEIPLTKPVSKRFGFGQLTFRPGDRHLTILATPASPPQQITIPFLAEGGEPREHAKLLVDDFTFDGAADLMVPSSTGYGGVNWFYVLYRYSRTAQRLEPVKMDEEFCNPAADPVAKVLKVPCKSGPAWHDDAFQFTAGGVPFRHRESSLVTLQGFPDDAEAAVYLIEYRDAGKKRLRSEVRDAEDPARPAVRLIPAGRVYLHTSANAKTRTGAYIVKGDRVELLDVTTEASGGAQWLQVAYRSARAGRLVRWICLSRAE